jgi:hypothetical protein
MREKSRPNRSDKGGRIDVLQLANNPFAFQFPESIKCSLSCFQATSEPFSCAEKEGKTVVTSHLVGNFPESPVDLRFFFKLEGDKIASLEIIP